MRKLCACSRKKVSPICVNVCSDPAPKINARSDTYINSFSSNIYIDCIGKMPVIRQKNLFHLSMKQENQFENYLLLMDGEKDIVQQLSSRVFG